MPDPRRMEILREVAEHGSFSAAAQALWMTQPAVSRQVAALEAEVGAILVERGARGVRLTDAGRILVEHATAIAGHVRAAEAELRALSELGAGSLRIGTFPSAGSTILLEALRAFHREHPAVDLAVAEGSVRTSLQRVRAGELELALVYGRDGEARPTGLEWIHLLTEEMEVALPLGHPLAGSDRVALSDLAGERWLVGPGLASSGLIHDACVRAGFEPEVACEADDPLLIGGLVAAGVGVTLVPGLSKEHDRPGIVIRPLREPPSRAVYAVLLESRNRSPAVVVLLDLLVAAGRRRAKPS